MERIKIEEILIINAEGNPVLIAGDGPLGRNSKSSSSTTHALVLFSKALINENIYFVRFEKNRLLFLKSLKTQDMWAVTLAELSEDPRIIIPMMRIILEIVAISQPIIQEEQIQGALKILHKELSQSASKTLFLVPHTSEGIRSIFEYMALRVCLKHSNENIRKRLYLVAGQISELELSGRISKLLPEAMISTCEPGTVTPVIPTCELATLLPGENSISKIVSFVAPYFPFISRVNEVVQKNNLSETLERLSEEAVFDVLDQLVPLLDPNNFESFSEGIKKEIQRIEAEIGVHRRSTTIEGEHIPEGIPEEKLFRFQTCPIFFDPTPYDMKSTIVIDTNKREKDFLIKLYAPKNDWVTIQVSIGPRRKGEFSSSVLDLMERYDGRMSVLENSIVVKVPSYDLLRALRTIAWATVVEYLSQVREGYLDRTPPFVLLDEGNIMLVRKEDFDKEKLPTQITDVIEEEKVRSTVLIEGEIWTTIAVVDELISKVTAPLKYGSGVALIPAEEKTDDIMLFLLLVSEISGVGFSRW